MGIRRLIMHWLLWRLNEITHAKPSAGDDHLLEGVPWCRSYFYTYGGFGWVLNLNWSEGTLCQGGGGRTGKKRKRQINGGSWLADVSQAHSQEVDLGRGNQITYKDSANAERSLLCTPFSNSRAGLGRVWRPEGGQPDVAGRGLWAGSSGRGCPWASKWRKGGSSPHLHCKTLASHWVAADPRRDFLASTAGAGHAALRQVATGQRRLDLHFGSFIHTFTHSRIHRLFSCGRSWWAKQSMIPRTITVPWLWGQMNGLESWPLHLLVM